MQRKVACQDGSVTCMYMYVRQIARSLLNRSRSIGKQLQILKWKTAVAEHAMNTGHIIDWANVKIYMYMAFVLQFHQRIALETRHMRSNIMGSIVKTDYELFITY